MNLGAVSIDFAVIQVHCRDIRAVFGMLELGVFHFAPRLDKRADCRLNSRGTKL